jgi:hypothetical protein
LLFNPGPAIEAAGLIINKPYHFGLVSYKRFKGCVFRGFGLWVVSGMLFVVGCGLVRREGERLKVDIVVNFDFLVLN